MTSGKNAVLWMTISIQMIFPLKVTISGKNEREFLPLPHLRIQRTSLREKLSRLVGDKETYKHAYCVIQIEKAILRSFMIMNAVFFEGINYKIII